MRRKLARPRLHDNVAAGRGGGAAIGCDQRQGDGLGVRVWIDGAGVCGFDLEVAKRAFKPAAERAVEFGIPIEMKPALAVHAVPLAG